MQTRLLVLVCNIVLFLGIAALPAKAQQENSNSASSATVEGTVVSASRDTLVVRGDDGRYHLFTYGDGATRPTKIAQGARVRVSASEPDQDGTRGASEVALLDPPSDPPNAPTARPQTTTDKGAQAAPVPPQVRNVEGQIRREARRWRMGVRTGAAFNPELFMFGVHSQMGPIFSPRIQFRPNAEFDFGEVTDLIALNLEGVYRFRPRYREAGWTPYVGLGPALIFIHQSYQAGRSIDFGNFDYETGFNVLAGVQSSRGTFVELKTSLYSGPAPKLRLIIGRTF